MASARSITLLLAHLLDSRQPSSSEVCMALPSGLEVIEDHEGFGDAAERGDQVTYNVRIFLNRGDEVPLNETQAQAGLRLHLLRNDGDRVLVDHKTVLGTREAVAGIENALV